MINHQVVWIWQYQDPETNKYRKSRRKKLNQNILGFLARPKTNLPVSNRAFYLSFILVKHLLRVSLHLWLSSRSESSPNISLERTDLQTLKQRTKNLIKGIFVFLTNNFISKEVYCWWNSCFVVLLFCKFVPRQPVPSILEFLTCTGNRASADFVHGIETAHRLIQGIL